MLAQALGADPLHHALHRRIDRSDRQMMRLDVRLQNAVSRGLDCGHHAIRTDDDHVIDIIEMDRGDAQITLGIGHHRLDDIADKCFVL